MSSLSGALHRAYRRQAVLRAEADVEEWRNAFLAEASAILGASLAVARAAASSAGLPLYRYLGGASASELPVPMVNVLSGGIHGGGNIDFQDFQVIPLRARRYSEALENVVAIYRAMKDVLKSRGVYEAGVADEGGYAPRLESNEAGFERMVEAIERAGFKPGEDAAIAVDVAASHLEDGGHYCLAREDLELDSSGLVERLERWTGRYPILSIEDGLGEEDWNGWKILTERLRSESTDAQIAGQYQEEEEDGRSVDDQQDAPGMAIQTGRSSHQRAVGSCSWPKPSGHSTRMAAR